MNLSHYDEDYYSKEGFKENQSNDNEMTND